MPFVVHPFSLAFHLASYNLSSVLVFSTIWFYLFPPLSWDHVLLFSLLRRTLYSAESPSRGASLGILGSIVPSMHSFPQPIKSLPGGTVMCILSTDRKNMFLKYELASEILDIQLSFFC